MATATIDNQTKTLPIEFNPKQSVLFVGAGFSNGCKNIKRAAFPSTSQIIGDFSKELDDPAADKDIQILSDALRRRDFNFHKYISDNFTCESSTKEVDVISAEPWMRCYTTNYDDAFELSRLNNRKGVNSYSAKSPFPKKILEASIVHLHGYVRDIEPNNSISDEIVLDGASYSLLRFKETNWWRQLLRDFRNAKHIFFVGYSLSDVAISQILVADPELKAKIFFITRDKSKTYQIETLEEYGTVEPIGVNGFVDYISEAANSNLIEQIEPIHLKSFRYIDPNKDNKSYSATTIVEVHDLLTKGKINLYRLLDPVASKQYVCPRTQNIETCVRLIDADKNVIISAWLGNGKTIFAKLLCSKLLTRGHNCFEYNPRHQPTEADFQSVAAIPNPVVFFDGLPNDDNIIEKFASQFPEVRLITLMRTAFFEANYGRILKLFEEKFDSVDINLLNENDLTSLRKISKSSGMTIQIEDMQHDYIRDFVLAAFENSSIQNSIKSSLQKDIAKSNFRNLLLYSLIYRLYNLVPDPSDMRDLIRTDPYNIIRDSEVDAQELFDCTGGNISLHSSILAEYIVAEYYETHEITAAIKELILVQTSTSEANRIDPDTGTLLRHSRIFGILKNKNNRADEIEKFYEGLRTEESISYHPLFWLQFSFVYDQTNLELAESHIDAAYHAAVMIPKFRTYQIDTQALRIYLLAETARADEPITRFSKILDRLDDCATMLSETKHIQYAIKVVELIPTFVRNRANAMDFQQTSALRARIDTIAEALGKVDPILSARFGATRVESKLNGIRPLLNLTDSQAKSEAEQV